VDTHNRLDEQDAIQRLKNADMRGLEALVSLHQLRAIRAAYFITQDLPVAEDIVQEAFLKLRGSIRGFDQSRAFAPWFLRSVVNAAIKAARRQSRQVPIDDEAVESLLADLRSGPEPVETQFEQTEFQERVWTALQALSPRQRAAIVQRYYLEMSEKEMSASLEAPPGTVKWLLNAARRNLKTLLGKEAEK